MKMTNYEADQHLRDLTGLKSLSVSISAVVGYRIMQNIHAIQDALRPYQDAVDDAVRRHSGGQERIDERDDPSAYAQCVEEIAALRQIEVDIPVQTIEIEALGEGNLPLSALFALDFMLGKR